MPRHRSLGRDFAMTIIQFEEGAVPSIGLSLEQASVSSLPSFMQKIRAGKSKTRCERGVDEDAERHRLTFFLENRRFPLIVNERGGAIERSTLDFGDRQLPSPIRMSDTWRHSKEVL